MSIIIDDTCLTFHSVVNFLKKKSISSDAADVVCWDEIDTDEEVLGDFRFHFLSLI